MKNRFFLTLAVFLILFLSSTAVLHGQNIRQNFEWIIAKRVTVTLNGITVQRGGVTVTDGGITVADDGLTLTDDDLTVTSGDVTVTVGDVTLADGDLTLSDNLFLVAQPVITVTTFFTPTGRYQPVLTTITRGVTITVGAEGMVTTITNVSTPTLTITDTGTLIMAGNLALGQYDNLTLRSDGTRWIELGRSNN